MCCRYYMELSPELRPFIEEARHTSLANRMSDKYCRPLTVSGEIRPTDITVVFAPDKNGQCAAFPMFWGFTGKSSYLFNARSETADQKPTFRDLWYGNRCVVPASHYYEWQHLISPEGKKQTGDKYMIQPKNSTRTLLAGLYRLEEKDGYLFPHFTILTREPSADIRFIHDRMPVILPEAAAAKWLDPGTDPAAVREIADRSMTDMVFERQRTPCPPVL